MRGVGWLAGSGTVAGRGYFRRAGGLLIYKTVGGSWGVGAGNKNEQEWQKPVVTIYCGPINLCLTRRGAGSERSKGDVLNLGPDRSLELGD